MFVFLSRGHNREFILLLCCVCRFGPGIRIVHFIGAIKPWQHRYLAELDAVILYPGTYGSQGPAQDFIKRWWQVFTSLEQQVCT